MAFHSYARFRPDDAISNFGSGVCRSRIEAESLVHENPEAAIAAHKNGELVRTVRSRGGGDVQNPAGVFEETLHSNHLSAR